jgi:hypothetical protein
VTEAIRCQAGAMTHCPYAAPSEVQAEHGRAVRALRRAGKRAYRGQFGVAAEADFVPFPDGLDGGLDAVVEELG